MPTIVEAQYGLWIILDANGAIWDEHYFSLDLAIYRVTTLGLPAACYA